MESLSKSDSSRLGYLIDKIDQCCSIVRSDFGCFQGEVSSFSPSDSMCVHNNVQIVSGTYHFNVQIVLGSDQLNDDDIGIECESATGISFPSVTNLICF